MLLRAWRLATIVLSAVSMGVAEAHPFEMPAKLGFEDALWLTLLQRLYPPAFGPIGGSIEAAAIFATIVLAILVRRRGSALGWTIAGAVCMVTAHAAFWIWIAPVNATLLPLTPDTLPENFIAFRNQWEYTHAIRAVLQLVALACVTLSAIVETPRHVHSDLHE